MRVLIIRNVGFWDFKVGKVTNCVFPDSNKGVNFPTIVLLVVN